MQNLKTEPFSALLIRRMVLLLHERDDSLYRSQEGKEREYQEALAIDAEINRRMDATNK